MKKWTVLPLLIAALFLGLPLRAAAAEIAADEPVYVAGNPDLFPFEYYDTRSQCYQGILPELYRQISQSTGLEFVYLHPGMVNQQSRLAKNDQVELVSAHVRGDVETAERELILLRHSGNTEVCVAFTDITPVWMEEAIRPALENLSDRQILELSLHVPQPPPEQRLYWWCGIIGGTLLTVIAVLAAVLLRHKKTEKKNDKTRLLDPLTGIGNQLYFENTFCQYVTPANHALYYLTYLSLDMQRVEQYLSTQKAEQIQRYAADVLSQSAAGGDFSARIGDGVFLFAFQAPTEEEAATQVTEILERLNRFEGAFLAEHSVSFRAGIFWIDTANLTAETAAFNAHQGYNAAAEQQCPYVFADKALLNSEAAKAALRRNLMGALEKREFLLYLQLIVDRNEQIIGAEALTRWQNREKGLLSPDAFIEPLKSAGLIDKLDFYILEEACRQLEQWSQTGKGHLWLSCNFTRLTVSRSDFAERFQDV